MKDEPIKGSVYQGLGEAEFGLLASSGEPAASAARRAAAFDRYRTAAAPAPRDEEWRRTDPALFPFNDFSRTPTLRVQPPLEIPPLAGADDVVVTVSETGYAVEDRGGAIGRGKLAVTPLAEAGEAFPAELPNAAGRKIEHLNAAFWNFGLAIRARDAVPVTLRLYYRLGAPRSFLLPRILVAVEPGAQLRIVEQMESPDGVPMLIAASRGFSVGQAGVLTWITVQEWGNGTLALGEDWGRAQSGGRVEWVSAALGGAVIKSVLGCDLQEPKSSARISGLYRAAGKQHVDQRTLQIHSAPDTDSQVLYKGTVLENSRSVYQGIIRAARDAVRVDAYQMNNNLVLSEGARADSLPGLEIDADDLKCSHGATMGSLDPEQVYYLQARGLSEADARSLIIAGFYEEVIGRIPVAGLQDSLRDRLQGQRRAV
jgi:Fe-S cluster assembly protein SufD